MAMLIVLIGCMSNLRQSFSFSLYAGERFHLYFYQIVLVLAFILAFVSASQDVVIDAYRADFLSEKERALGATYTQVSYRIALKNCLYSFPASSFMPQPLL